LPEWTNDDYETIYVFHITRAGSNGTPRATLEIQIESSRGLELSRNDVFRQVR